MPAWIQVADGNAVGRALFRRHYSYNSRREQMSIFPSVNRNYALFVGPGEKLVLITHCERALFVWRKFKSADSQAGVNCAVFRNEGAGRSSELIRVADDIAWQRWPFERHYTYINPRKVTSRNPGYCFLMAGWRYVRDASGNRVTTKARNLLVMERWPEELQNAHRA